MTRDYPDPEYWDFNTMTDAHLANTLAWVEKTISEKTGVMNRFKLHIELHRKQLSKIKREIKRRKLNLQK